MDDAIDFVGFMFIAIILAAFAFFMGALTVMPNELEDGCIVYEESIYCERK